MIEFRISAVDKSGRKIELVRHAEAEMECARQLMAEGMTPISIKSGSIGLMERLNKPISLGASVNNNDQALILNQLAILTQSGLPVDRSLDLLGDQLTGKKQKEIITQILSDVRSGNSLAEAMDAREIFPRWVIGVIRSSEIGGNLAHALQSVADQMKRGNETRTKLITALTYPAAVLLATIAALALVLVFVVPQFKPIFEGSEDKLPDLTNMVIALSDNITTTIPLAIMGIIILMLLLIMFLKSDRGNALRQNHPKFFPGQALRDQYLSAQFSGLMGTLILNGVNILMAFKLSKEAMNSKRWRDQLSDVETRIREGTHLSDALRLAPAFPRTVRRLIEVGEHSGKLGDTCRQASNIMQDAAVSRIERIVSLVNPIAIIMLGGLVALLVAGVMLGIFALGDFAG